ncbi:hypothetical protein [Ruminococcus flavefaciens]|uniref:hypothetical protein n=1 Tax=Ruminococcus flavefaciens TaxID=1265 RepID=UPI0026EB26C0|nr:hypothetical protein [Ruminococcus flavefaciens]MDD7515758.1 hypothetical protein [Ruminococcus flavefaciens]MDY5693031.1 hypothetical protein [Ruminococcus flavefaciens]
MAFCRFCGKQIPDGGSCDCSASKAAAEVKETAENEANSVQEKVENAAENVKNEAEKAVENVKEAVSEVKEDAEKAGNGFKQINGNDIAKKVDGLAGEISENLPGGMKNNKSAVYIAAGVVLVLFICLLCLIFGGGAKSAVKKYINSASDKRGGKTYYSLTLPKAAIKELKDDDDFDEMVDDFNDMVEDAIYELEDDQTMPKFDKIVKKTKLKNSDLKNAEGYFEAQCELYDADDDDIEVTKGYEMKVKTKAKDEDGDADYEKLIVCVVKLKGDGWKVIPSSAKNLKYYD